MASRSRSWTNLSGLILSIGCVIHCMLMPLCLASLPSWGLDWLVSPRVHQSLALVGIAVGMATLVPGWREHHRSSVLLLALIGLSVMNYAAFAGENCCAIDSSEDSPACCRHTCCADTQAGQSTTAASPAVVAQSSTFSGLASLFQWLWVHPTACGAALLAWAHCLNGRCTRGCCQTGEPEVFALDSGS